MLSSYAMMINNKELKTERGRKKNKLRNKFMWFGNMLTYMKYSYISIYDLELYHNIFIVKSHCMDKHEKSKNIMCRT
jgi:hypothetical protein